MGWLSLEIYRKNPGVNFSGDPMENSNDVCFDKVISVIKYQWLSLMFFLWIQWQLLQQLVYDVFFKVLMIKQTVQQDIKYVTLLINIYANTWNITVFTYLPLYNAHFFFPKRTRKIGGVYYTWVRTIHG